MYQKILAVQAVQVISICTLNELGYHLDEIHTAKPRAEVEESFRVLRNYDKWILSTGTVVEEVIREKIKIKCL